MAGADLRQLAARHRGRGRLADATCDGAGPGRRIDARGRHRHDARPSTATEPHGRRPSARPGDRRDPGLPRREHLVVRQGDPPRRRPRRASRTGRPTGCRASPSALLELLPGLRNHSCSRGRKGGFVERLDEGTWLGHVTEHVALQLQQEVGHDLRRGKTRQVPGEPGRYNVIYGYVDENVGIAAGRLAVRLVNHLVQAEPGLRLRGASSSASSSAPSGRRSARRRRRSSTRRSHATSPGSGSTSTRWSSSARASTRSGSGPR